MKKAQRLKNKSRRLFSDRVSAVIMALLTIAMLVTIALLVSQRFTKPAPPSDYEGTIVDRWADYAETVYGSRPRMALVVETADGKRFTVGVEPSVYESAKVGMRIKSKSGQIILIEKSADGR